MKLTKEVLPARERLTRADLERRQERRDLPTLLLASIVMSAVAAVVVRVLALALGGGS